jgi:hypothetical protein
MLLALLMFVKIIIPEILVRLQVCVEFVVLFKTQIDYVQVYAPYENSMIDAF